MDIHNCGTCVRFGTWPESYGGGFVCSHEEDDWSEDLEEEDIEYHKLHGCDEWKPLCWKPEPREQIKPIHSLPPPPEFKLSLREKLRLKRIGKLQ